MSTWCDEALLRAFEWIMIPNTQECLDPSLIPITRRRDAEIPEREVEHDNEAITRWGYPVQLWGLFIFLLRSNDNVARLGPSARV